MDNDRSPLTAEEERLVLACAGRVHRWNVPEWARDQIEVEDLAQVGRLAVLKAREGLQGERDSRYFAYLKIRVSGDMKSFLRVAPHVRLPQEKWHDFSLCRETEEALRAEGVAVSVQVLADHLGWTREKVSQIRSLDNRIQSLDQAVEGETGARALSVSGLLDDRRTPDQAVQRRQLAGYIQACLDAIQPPENRLVLVARVLQDMKLRELAEIMGCSQQRVAQREASARRSIRDCLERHGVTIEDVDFLDEA